MKLKKILGIVVAVAMIGALAVSASAGIINGNGEEFGEGDSKYVLSGTGTIQGFTVTFDLDTPEDGFGGGIIWYGDMFEDGWWDAAGGAWTEWGDADAGKPIVSDGSTIVVTLDTPMEIDGPFVMVEAWWGGDITITGVQLNQVTAANNANETGGGDAPVVPAESGDKEPDTGLGDVAVASAIALLAAGAVVFNRRKK